ncbi:MAG: DNA topoisomerase, partial [Clostridia bacterium]
GELVARWIIQKAGFRKPVFRFWVSSQTDRAIRDGFNNLRPDSEFHNLFLSAQCRAEADWYVGLNVTRALTCKYNAQLSAGRVQTPTLAMIVAREQEIRKFTPQDYFYINAAMDGFTLIWRDRATKSTRISNRSRADDILDKCRGVKAKLSNIRREKKRDAAPLLYDLTELQRDANRRFGFSAKQTLNIMQSLYEIHKILTYPRTDSRYITTDVVPTLRERLKGVSGAGYPLAGEIIRGGIRATRRFVDDSKVTDHHAIIPTEAWVDINALGADERRIYDLVVKRFLAVLMPDFEYEQTTVYAEIAGETFYARGKIVKSRGWKSVYDAMGFVEDDSDTDADVREQALPNLPQGGTLPVSALKLGVGKTAPP